MCPHEQKGKALGSDLKRQAEDLTRVGKVEGKQNTASGEESPYLQVDRALKRVQYSQDALIEVLHAAQETFGFLSDDTMNYIARELKLPPTLVYGVATFYHFFNLKPQGEHSCTICMGTACFVKRVGDIVESMEKEFDVKAGETTKDGKLSVNIARCLGNCGLAPMTILDGEVHARQTPDTLIKLCKDQVKK